MPVVAGVGRGKSVAHYRKKAQKIEAYQDYADDAQYSLWKHFGMSEDDRKNSDRETKDIS